MRYSVAGRLAPGRHRRRGSLHPVVRSIETVAILALDDWGAGRRLGLVEGGNFARPVSCRTQSAFARTVPAPGAATASAVDAKTAGPSLSSDGDTALPRLLSVPCFFDLRCAGRRGMGDPLRIGSNWVSLEGWGLIWNSPALRWSVVGLVPFLVYLRTMAPTVYGLDSRDFRLCCTLVPVPAASYPPRGCQSSSRLCAISPHLCLRPLPGHRYRLSPCPWLPFTVTWLGRDLPALADSPASSRAVPGTQRARHRVPNGGQRSVAAGDYRAVIQNLSCPEAHGGQAVLV